MTCFMHLLIANVHYVCRLTLGLSQHISTVLLHFSTHSDHMVPDSLAGYTAEAFGQPQNLLTGRHWQDDKLCKGLPFMFGKGTNQV